MPPHIFKKENGFEPHALIQSGVDHIAAAEELFARSPSYFDSAGYLVHMGFELLLKAWHLEEFGEFSGTHSLKDLTDQLRAKGQQLNLSGEEIKTLEFADLYEMLRYPNPNNEIEVGDDDWVKIDCLLATIWNQAPEIFHKFTKSVDPTRKGGRILMKRKIL